MVEHQRVSGDEVTPPDRLLVVLTASLADGGRLAAIAFGVALAALSNALGAGGAVQPTAAALLQARLPNGQFVIPTPQADGRYSGSAIRFARSIGPGNG